VTAITHVGLLNDLELDISTPPYVCMEQEDLKGIFQWLVNTAGRWTDQALVNDTWLLLDIMADQVRTNNVSYVYDYVQ